MPSVEVDLPSDLEVEIQRLVEDGEFLDRKEAVGELLATGVHVYDVETGADGEMDGFEDVMRETSERSLGDDYEF